MTQNPAIPENISDHSGTAELSDARITKAVQEFAALGGIGSMWHVFNDAVASIVGGTAKDYAQAKNALRDEQQDALDGNDPVRLHSLPHTPQERLVHPFLNNDAADKGRAFNIRQILFYLHGLTNIAEGKGDKEDFDLIRYGVFCLETHQHGQNRRLAGKKVYTASALNDFYDDLQRRLGRLPALKMPSLPEQPAAESNVVRIADASPQKTPEEQSGGLSA